MNKKHVTALVVSACVGLLCIVVQWGQFLQTFELKTLDQRFRLFANPHQASQDLVLVTIDDASLAAYGRWPWARDRHGYVVDYLHQAGAKAVIFDVLFLEPDLESPEFDDVFAHHIEQARNVVLPFILDNDMPLGARFPIQPLRQHSNGLGFINLFADTDGIVRRLPLVSRVADRTYLQLSVAVAQAVEPTKKLTLQPTGISLGETQIPLSADGQLLINWHGRFEQQIYPTYPIGAVLQSYLDRLENRQPLLSPELFKDKIVFIAATAAGLYDLRVTPVSPISPGVMIHMAVLDNLLQGNFLRTVPSAITFLSLLLITLGTSFSYLCIERLWLKLCGVGAIGLGYLAIALIAFARFDFWVDTMVPMLAWALTCVTAATVAFFTEGKERRYLRTVFDKYMAAEVVDEILRDPKQIKLGGEKQNVTLFFSDVAGFTTIAEQLEPEILVKLLNEYLSLMTDIIMQHRGNVNKYLGDGIMAFFGAPRYEPEHASQACLAALDCQRQLTQLQARWTARGYPFISTRIGLNSGQVVLGNMGSASRMEYTAMGDCVNLASRLEGANKYYGTEILLGSHTYQLAKHNIVAREIDAIRVKGKQQPVVVYELLATLKDVEPQQQQLLTAFMRGLTCYKTRDFLNAQRYFEVALSITPDDGPSQLYQQRTRAYLQSPPPDNWDGVYELKHK
jgi:adenylate cyclase